MPVAPAGSAGCCCWRAGGRRRQRRKWRQSPAPGADNGAVMALALTPVVGYKYFATAIGVHGADHTGVLHGFDQPCGAIVAYAQLALHRGDGRLAAFDDKGHGFVVEGVRLRVPLLATVTVAVAGHRD